MEAAGVFWIAGAALVVASFVVRWDTPLPSGVASTTQSVGVVAVVAAVLTMVWGFASLARAVGRGGDTLGAVLLWALVAGIPLLPLFLGGYLVAPAFLVLIVRGRLGSARVRLPAAALMVGLMSWTAGLGWPEVLEGPSTTTALRFSVRRSREPR